MISVPQDSWILCVVRRMNARDIEDDGGSLRLCIRPSDGDYSPGHDEFRACLF